MTNPVKPKRRETDRLFAQVGGNDLHPEVVRHVWKTYPVAELNVGAGNISKQATCEWIHS